MNKKEDIPQEEVKTDVEQNKPAKEDVKVNVPRLVVGIITNVLLAAFVAFTIAFVIIQNMSPEASIQALGYKTFLIANTRSMEPTLVLNDMVFVKDNVDYSTELYSEEDGGKMVAFYYPIDNNPDNDIVVVHRVAGIVTNEDDDRILYYTKGDNVLLTNPDLCVLGQEEGMYNNRRVSRYIGVVDSTSRFLGNVTAFFQSPVGIFVIVHNTICVLIIVWVLTPSKEEIAEARQEKEEKKRLKAKQLPDPGKAKK